MRKRNIILICTAWPFVIFYRFSNAVVTTTAMNKHVMVMQNAGMKSLNECSKYVRVEYPMINLTLRRF